MTNSVFSKFSLTCVLLLGLSSSALAEFEYRFHWGRMPVAEFSLTLPTTESRKIRVEGQTVGLVGKLFKYDGALEADYSDMSRVLFRVSGEDNGFSEYRTIQFSPDGPAEILEFLDDEIEEPPSEVVDSMGITVDPFRVVLVLLESSSDAGSNNKFCEGEYSVFDGKRHYELALNVGESADIEADRSWTYSGKALRCDMSVSYLESAGGEEQNPWYEEDAEVRTMWLAEIEELLVPVRITMPGPIGKITGRLRLAQDPL
ncbi:MAG: DUF3108 domain-containing protein [Porticoccaceae bacterium]|nr:DUF3108 domain-containing protein [Porticoccaceae bacterium]